MHPILGNVKVFKKKKKAKNLEIEQNLFLGQEQFLFQGSQGTEKSYCHCIGATM